MAIRKKHRVGYMISVTTSTSNQKAVLDVFKMANQAEELGGYGKDDDVHAHQAFGRSP